MICEKKLLIMFFDEPKLILFHTVQWFQILLCITNSSIKRQWFVYTHLNDLKVLLLTIQFNISHLFGHCLNVKQFFFIHR